MKTLKIKRIHPDAITPTRAHKHDAGLDLYALEDTQIRNGQCGLVKTGIAVSVPKGYEAQVRPRSGMTLKTDFKVQLGTIDSGYEGDVGIIVYNADVRNLNKAAWISARTKIAQLVVSPIVTPTVEVVDDFENESARGTNGFGSTDLKVRP